MTKTTATLVSALVMISLCSCQSTSSFYGERRLKPSEVTEIAVLIDDSADNSDLRGNDFLRSSLIDAVCSSLSDIGVKAVDGTELAAEDVTSSHVLILKSYGMSKTQGYHQSSPQTMTTYHSGINSQGQAYTYGTPETFGGGGNTYTTTEVRGVATLLERCQSSETGFKKVCQVVADGDGMNLLEKRFSMTTTAQLTGYKKKPEEIYRDVFIKAARDIFESE